MEATGDWKRGNVTPLFKRDKVEGIQANQYEYCGEIPWNPHPGT